MGEEREDAPLMGCDEQAVVILSFLFLFQVAQTEQNPARLEMKAKAVSKRSVIRPDLLRY